MGKFLKKIVNIIEKLSSKPRIDGLEITGAAVKYSIMEGGDVRTSAVKLSPGIISSGKLADREHFVEALAALKSQISPEKKDKVFRVNVVLPTPLVFTQSFSVPNLNPEEIGESVNLNLEMISPIPKDEANMSAQIISEHDLDYEFFGAFAEKKEVGAYQAALIEAGFIPVSFEFQAVAISRFMKKTSIISKKLVLVFEVSPDGLELFILINGNIYFSYFRSWQSVQGTLPSIPRDVFDGAVVEEIRKVLNFTSGKFGISPDSILILAPGFENEIENVVKENFSLKTGRIISSQIKANPVFYSVVGAAMRWQSDEDNKNLLSINLGGEDLSKAIYDEQILNFVSLWRGILGSVLALLLVAYIAGALFVVSQYKIATANLSDFKPPLDTAKLADLESKSAAFNSMIQEINNVRGASQDFYTPIKHLSDLSAADHITIQSIDINSISSPVNISASAPNYDTVLSFKNALSSDSQFSNVNLPLTQIVTQNNNSVSFDISFNIVQ